MLQVFMCENCDFMSPKSDFIISGTRHSAPHHVTGDQNFSLRHFMKLSS